MTYGEEPGPETHRDSAVLTYLEGLLMHPVAFGPGATATRRPEAGSNNSESGNRVNRGIQSPNHVSSPPEKGSTHRAASQHLKKARLLRSGNWSETDNQKKDPAAVQVNGLGEEHHKISLDNSPQGESTLLASLLQSFSSRLQTVALSQSITQSHKKLDGESNDRSPTDKDTIQGYCTASSRLKSLIRKNKQECHNTVPYSRHNSQEKRSASPCSSQSSVPDSVSCAERLKAVASLVKSRTSPAPSPKPSLACSQLALLLSSEAHLQKYSQEQALKAQLCGRSASERLAAMATQQNTDNRPPSMGESVFGQDMLSPFNSLNGSLSSPTLKCSQRSPPLSLSQSAPTSSPRPSPHTPKEKRPFDRHSNRPPQNCSSLLLLLLNNHNSQKHLTKNGHLEDDFTAPLSQATSAQSDSEYSHPDSSLTKDSSDAESCYSSCSPIDLSTKSRGFSQKSEPPSLPSSLDKLTETLISKWKSDTVEAKVPESRESEISPDMTSHHKVTLMQLLLDHRNNETVNKIAPHSDLQDATAFRNMTGSPVKWLGTQEESRTKNSFDQLMGRQLSTSSLSGDTSKTPSPYSYSSPIVQSSPLNLCKSKQHTSENLVKHAFTASKLLQNLAQCGLQNVSPMVHPQSYRPQSDKQKSPEPEVDMSQTAMGIVAGSIKTNKHPLFEPPPAVFSPFTRPEHSPLASTQIENLLERRTILQLLLGTASHKEKSTERRSTEVALGVHEEPPQAYLLCDGINGPSLNVTVKTEPADESLLSCSSDDAKHRWRPGCESHSPVSEAHSHGKEEAKYGLLSQLLKQKTTTYHSSPRTEKIVSTVKAEQQDYQVPLPKKRKLCLELAEHLSKELCRRPVDTVSECMSNTPEAHKSRRLTSPKEEDLFSKSPASQAPMRDGQSFNVLKQLLLSDNCLKEISQPQGEASSFLPQANCMAHGNFSQSSYNDELVNFPWFPQTCKSGPGHYIPLSCSPENSIQGSSRDKGTSLRPSPKPVKKETVSPLRWTLASEDKREPGADSPPLMRSNPILYYMLQRRNSHVKNEAEDHGQRTHGEVTVKVEPCADERYHDSGLNKISLFSGLREKPQI